jgi:hypothetical protein
MRTALALVLVFLADMPACTPEASRTRGGGRGADVDNRGGDVLLHEARRPYFNTPVVTEAR